MNVIHLNALTNGGAASGAYRLHEAMLRSGVNSVIFTGQSNKKDDKIISIGNQTNYLTRVEQKLFNSIKSNNAVGNYFYKPMYSCSPTARKLIDIINKEGCKPDLFIAHWTTGFADTKTFYRLQKEYKAPFIWYMSDMEPMTAGCHYVFSCNQYKNRCLNCEAFSKGFHWIPNHYYKQKEKYLRLMDLKIVASSQYMLNMANEASLFKGLEKTVIHRGIDSDIFKPVEDISVLRSRWNLYEQDVVLFFGAQSIDDKRKGMNQLLAALEIVFNRLQSNPECLKRVKILLAGKDNGITDRIPFKVEYAGFMKTQEDLSSLYKASDAYICPTLQDSGPMMASESLMCGVPVLGYKMGVLPDVVTDGITGYLADVGDVEDLANVIEKFVILSDEERVSMKKESFEFAINNLTYKQQVEKIVKFAAQSV